MLPNETLRTMRDRRSTRNFHDEQVTAAELEAVLAAGVWAPSAGNRQAWRFTVIQKRDLLARLNREAKEQAKQHEQLRQLANNEGFNIFHGAPTVILVSGEETAIAIESDCAAATENMLLAAESLGLGACWVNFVLLAFSGRQGQELLRELNLPADYRPYASVALGYRKAAVTEPPRKPDLINYIK